MSHNDFSLLDTLANTLAIDTTGFTPETPLLGAIAELDSMAIMTLLFEFESQLGIEIDGTELSGEDFATVASLQAFIDRQTS